MRTHAIGSRSRSTNPHVDSNGLLTLTGYGLKLAVERGHLHFEDGIGAARRSGRLSRATSNLRRVVVLGHSGYVTIEAMRWLHDVGAALIHIDADGTVVGVDAPRRLDDARLRRAQALAFTNGVGIQLTKELVRDKLLAQARLLEQHFGSPLHTNIEALAEAVASGKNATEIRTVEAAGAALYWSVWSNEPVKFARRDTARLPEHWRSFGSRSSAITGTPRSASNPANALLNYAYAVLEAEATIALATMGLDPGMGVFHTDLRARDSLACDIMEPLRSTADELVLRVLRTRVFSARDFRESRDGVCRISASLARALCDLAPTLRPLLATRTEELASRLLKSSTTGERWDRKIPTLLSGENRKSVPSKAVRRPAFPRVCQECGAAIPRRNRLCASCSADVGVRSREFITAGPTALKRLRSEDRDPAHGGKARQRRASTMSARNRARREWTTDGADYSAERFRREILSEIQAVPLNELRRRTGLSLRYVSIIRRGEKLPHPRHWGKLRGSDESQAQ